jgi:hypothetical protein
VKFLYSASIIAGLISSSVHAMDQEPSLISELICRSGYLDFDLNSLCSVVLVCRQWSIPAAQYVTCLLVEREKALENDYNKRLQKKQFDRGALLTLRKDRLVYGFIGVKIVSEETCAHGEHCQLSLQWVKFRKCEDITWSSPSSHCITIVTTWGDPEPITEKYPWIDKFKNPAQRALRYASVGNSAWEGPVSINKPYFRPDGSLRAEVHTFLLSNEPTTDLFSTINEKHEYVIGDNGGISTCASTIRKQ